MISEGQYVVLYSLGGAEEVYATAYGEGHLASVMAACVEEHPDADVRFAKASRHWARRASSA